MSNLVLNMAVDTSGQLYDTIYVGLISIRSDSIKKFEKEFKKKFPKFYRYKEKGTKRSPSELKNIISFMNEKRYIRMFTICLNKKEWGDFIQQYDEVSYLPEKAYALLYCYLFSKVCFKYLHYNVVICEENYINTDKIIEYSNYLNKYLKRNILISKGKAKSTFFNTFSRFYCIVP